MRMRRKCSSAALVMIGNTNDCYRREHFGAFPPPEAAKRIDLEFVRTPIPVRQKRDFAHQG